MLVDVEVVKQLLHHRMISRLPQPIKIQNLKIELKNYSKKWRKTLIKGIGERHPIISQLDSEW